MKLIVFSDSHRELANMCRAIESEQPDYAIHLGDHDSDAEQLCRAYPTLPLAYVRGNCDGWSATPLTLTPVYRGVRMFLCHGHTYGVKGGPLRAIYAAMEQNAEILLFGHTHEPFLDQTPGGLRVLNPGSCGDCWRPTYGLIEIGADGTVSLCWKDMNGEEHK